jgi:hypothetical protein
MTEVDAGHDRATLASVDVQGKGKDEQEFRTPKTGLFSLFTLFTEFEVFQGSLAVFVLLCGECACAQERGVPHIKNRTLFTFHSFH